MSLQGQMGAHVQKDNCVLCARTHAQACWWQGLRAPGCSECGLHGCRWSQGVFPDFPVGWMSAVCSEEPLESFIHSTNIYWTDVLTFLLWGFPFLGLPCGSCPPLPPLGEGSPAALKGEPCERCLPLIWGLPCRSGVLLCFGDGLLQRPALQLSSLALAWILAQSPWGREAYLG